MVPTLTCPWGPAQQKKNAGSPVILQPYKSSVQCVGFYKTMCGWYMEFMVLNINIVLAVMSGEADRYTPIHVHCLINSNKQ